MSSPLRSCPFLLLLGVLPALIATSGAAQSPTFTWGNPHPQGNGLEAVAFEDALLGHAVGLLGARLTTADGGVTWVDRTDRAAFPTDLHDVLVLGPGSILAVGGAPGIFKSTDGGASFAPVANPSAGSLRSLVRVSGTTLSAVGDDGQVLRSTGRPGSSSDSRTDEGPARSGVAHAGSRLRPGVAPPAPDNRRRRHVDHGSRHHRGQLSFPET